METDGAGAALVVELVVVELVVEVVVGLLVRTSRRQVAAATCRASASGDVVDPEHRRAALERHDVGGDGAGARSVWSAAPAILPRKLLREVPTTTGRPMATISSRRRSSSRLWSTVLPKPMPGSSQTRSSSDALPHGERESLLEERLHLGDDVVVARVVLHGARLAEHVHEAAIGAATRRPAGHAGVEAEGGDVVDDRGAGSQGGARPRPAWWCRWTARSPAAASRSTTGITRELLRRRRPAPRPAGWTRRRCRASPPPPAEPPPVLHRRVASRNSPPSEKESGVTFMTPMITGACT